jgi:Type VI immunity for VRR-NUC
VTRTTDSGGRPWRLLAAVAARHGADHRSDLIEAMRAGVEDVIGPAVGVDLAWSTTVIRRTDDLERGTVPEVVGLAWPWRTRQRPTSRRPMSAGTVRVSALRPAGWIRGPIAGRSRCTRCCASPTCRPARRRWPARCSWVPCSAAVSAPTFPGPPRALLVAAAEGMGAETGYVADAFDAASSWELAVGAGPSARDVTRTVWGYGWCTLLSPAHLMRLGGAERLAQVPGAVVLVGPDNRVLIRLDADPAAVTAEQLGALRDLLLPVLPAGSRSVADYRALLASDPYVVSPDYRL